ncbi:hypothetical protein HJD18_04605 [Thermoleophilia bacterium SCSIO 60948]|nr:hypothetical protein HJD18_04605 [Thermoleophilia bacterium SCSIO 60948]
MGALLTGPRRRRRKQTKQFDIELLPSPTSNPISPRGPVASVQEAEADIPVELLAEMWNPEYLERLAHSYWRWLRRISLGALRIIYRPSSRTIVLLTPRLPLLRFRRPEYVTDGLGQVTWRIERGLLVARSGRGRGYLRLTIRKVGPGSGDTCRVRVRAEVTNFYPFLRGSGIFARIGVFIYTLTQLRIHILVTKGFLRSLARLDLPPSPVGALADADNPDGPKEISA